jgi:hypothetical protein
MQFSLDHLATTALYFRSNSTLNLQRAAQPAVGDLILVRRMEPTSYRAKFIRALLLPVPIMIAYRVYQSIHSPLARGRQVVFALIVTVITVFVIAALTSRKRAKTPANSQLPPFTLAAIALTVIIIAVVFRYL